MTPSPARLAGYRRIERRTDLPWVMKAFLAAAIVVLCGSIVWVGMGQVGPFVSSVVAGFGGLVSKIGAAAGSTAPSQTPGPADAPTIVAPDQPYTNSESVNVTVNVPANVTGKDGYTVRLYVTLPDQEAQLLKEQPVGPTSVEVLADVALVPGRNDMQAAINGPGGESERSAVATWILDQSRPKITVISPKNNAQVKQDKVTIKGKSQAGSVIRLQDAANGAIATVKAGSDGLWSATLAIADGGNAITITATDPAGNANTAQLNVRKGAGKLTAVLTGSAYRFKASRLPRRITLTVTVTGPDGRRLGGASALFTVSVPGLQAIVSGQLQTNSKGVATFTTTIPKGAMPGSGLATVLVDAGGTGTITDRQVLTVTE